MRLGSWLEISEDDGYNLEMIKTRLMVPNPEYVSRMQQGFSTAGLNRFDPLFETGYRDGKKVIRVPRGLVNKYGKGKDIIDEREEGKKVDFKFKLKLGPTEEREEDQVDFVDAVVKATEKRTGAIGQASPGYGKTACALASVARLGRTTAVLVHKSFLMNQWVERIQEAFDIDPKDIGIVQQDVCDYKGKKIVLIMAQSLLSSREYPEDMYSYFGTVVVDEVHRFGAVEFRKAITKFPAKYRIGVTATPKRKDGLEEVFFMHIGEIAFVGSKRSLTAKIQYVNANMVIPDSMRRGMLNWKKQYDMNKVTQYIVDCETRNRQIVKLLIDALKAGRKVMVLSSRREHLNVLHDMFAIETAKKQVRFTQGFYVGGMAEKDLRITATRHLILACVPEDTECLTLEGWKQHSELELGELIAAYDMEKKCIRYVPLQDVSRYQHDGPMLSVDRRSAQILMTPDHRNVVMAPCYVNGKQVMKEIIVRGYELTPKMKIRVNAPVDYPEIEGIGEDLAELIGWVIAEGSYVSGNRALSIQVHQNAGPKADRLDKLFEVLKIDVAKHEYNAGQISWYIPASFSKELIRKYCPDKKLTQFLVSLPKNEAQRLFDGLIGGDGHRRKDGRLTFTQKDEETVDWFMILAMRLGYRPTKSRRPSGVFDVYLTKKEFIGLYDGKYHVKEVPFSGVVWCPKTECGTWVARRNGTVFVTGNTFQMAQEGLDIPDLDTLFLTTPKGDVVQAVGRILRKHDGKKAPMVVDILDDGIPLCANLAKKRAKQYREMGCTF